MGYYTGKKIWITGASSGIGEAFAKQLAEEGAILILSARSEEKLKQLISTLANSSQHTAVVLDMQNKDAIAEQSEAILNQFGAVDILINNAGISQRSLVRDTLDAVDVSILETNLLGPIRHTKALLPKMIEQGYGHIVVMSSVTGKIGTPYRSSYAASKHGLHGFYDSLRAEEEKNGIQVSIICPGYISTHISQNALVGTGNKQGTKDEKSAKGLSPKAFAEKALKKISKGKKEIIIGGTETLGIYIKRFFPGILRKIIVNVKP